MRIGIVGGSFNPPHIGHASLIQYALAVGQFDQIVVAPCYKHPFKQNLLPFEERIAMCKLMTRQLLPSNVIVIDYERDINTGHTYDLVNMIVDTWADDDYTLILGEDLQEEFDTKWYKSSEIRDMVDIMWVPIQIYAPIRGEDRMLLPYRSSTVRRFLGEGKDISHFVPKSIINYLTENELIDGLAE